MAFHSRLPGGEEASNFPRMAERDAADAYVCPTIELSKAVSVSLGLDPLSSPLTGVNQCHGGGAFTDRDPAGDGNCSRGAPEPGAAVDMSSEGSRLVLAHGGTRHGDFGPACPDARRNSCADAFMDGAPSATRGSVISRFVCKEPSVFMNSRVTEVVPFGPHSAYSAEPSAYADTRGAWCANERASGDRPQPRRGGFDRYGFLCKSCNCGQTSLGFKQECHCAWYGRGEESGKGRVQAAAAQAYGQVETYTNAVPQGQTAFSAIKIEPTVWVDCTDRSFR